MLNFRDSRSEHISIQIQPESRADNVIVAKDKVEEKRAIIVHKGRTILIKTG